MRLIDHSPAPPNPCLTEALKIPGCPHVPLPDRADGLDFQARWSRSHRDRLSDPDLLTVAQISTMTELAEADVLALIQDGRALALTDASGELRLPYWQFFEPLWSHLPLIKAARRHYTPYGFLRFLESASEGLWGMTPRAAIERGHLEYVLADAEWGHR